MSPSPLPSFGSRDFDCQHSLGDEKKGPDIVRAKHVILALPKAPLFKIQLPKADPELEKEFRSRLDAVFGFPLLKCFFFVNNPYWSDDRQPNDIAPYVPGRELQYSKNRDKTKGMIMLYTDRPGTQFWNDYLSHPTKSDQTEGGRLTVQESAVIWRWLQDIKKPKKYGDRKIEKFENDRLLRRFIQYVRDNSAEDITPDRLLLAGMRDWGLPPFGAAAHSWRPGSQSRDILEKLKAFNLISQDNVPRWHVCGEAYSNYHAFIEGALWSAKDVVCNICDALKWDTPEFFGENPNLPRTRKHVDFEP